MRNNTEEDLFNSRTTESVVIISAASVLLIIAYSVGAQFEAQGSLRSKLTLLLTYCATTLGSLVIVPATVSANVILLSLQHDENWKWLTRDMIKLLWSLLFFATIFNLFRATLHTPIIPVSVHSKTRRPFKWKHLTWSKM